MLGNACLASLKVAAKIKHQNLHTALLVRGVLHKSIASPHTHGATPKQRGQLFACCRKPDKTPHTTLEACPSEADQDRSGG